MSTLEPLLPPSATPMYLSLFIIYIYIIDFVLQQGSAVLWSQMPIDLFVKQLELYNDYLEIYVREQFGSANKEEQNEDSDYTSLMNDSKEKQAQERMHELALCKTKCVVIYILLQQ